MNFREAISNAYLSPKIIYSRHEAKLTIDDLLLDGENFIIGLEKQDKLFKLFRTRWFLTETKLIFITPKFPLQRERKIFNLDEIEEITVFEEDDLLVIKTNGTEHKFELHSREERNLAHQAVEQYNRIKEYIESAEERKQKQEELEKIKQKQESFEKEQDTEQQERDSTETDDTDTEESEDETNQAS